jgi:hypothetical protein
MSNKKEDNSSNYSTSKTNSSSINKDQNLKNEEDNDLFPKQRQRVGIKNKMNINQPGRATISVPLSSFNGISHNASFQSKLLFFNGGKPRPKFQHIPYAHERIAEDNKKKNNINNKFDKKFEKKVEKKNEKKIEKKEEKKFEKKEEIKIEKKEEKKTDLKKEEKKIEKNKYEKAFNNINSNININYNINLGKQNKYNGNNNEGNENLNAIDEEDEDFEMKMNNNIKFTNTIYIPSSKVPSLSLDYKIPGFSKIQKEDKTKNKEQNQIMNLKLKSLDEQWSFQKILLDYNILDFTSKFYFY